MPVIARVLWGSDFEGSRWGRVWHKDVKACSRREDKEGFHVYVYGKANADNLRTAGYKHVHLVDPDPYPNWADRKVKEGESIRRPWRNKMELMIRAIEDHGEVIYIDWDIPRRAPSALEVFDRLAGRTLSLTLYTNWRKQSLWDPVPSGLGIRPSVVRRSAVSGFCIHVKGDTWIREVLAEMSEGPHERWHDEQVITRKINREYGGWPGCKIWLERYENPVLAYRDFRSPWGKPVRRTEDWVERNTVVPFRWHRLLGF